MTRRALMKKKVVFLYVLTFCCDLIQADQQSDGELFFTILKDASLKALNETDDSATTVAASNLTKQSTEPNHNELTNSNDKVNLQTLPPMKSTEKSKTELPYDVTAVYKPQRPSSPACPPLSYAEVSQYTQEKFTNILTDACRYDKLIKPDTDGPLDVFLQIDLRHIEAIDQLQFKAHMVIQFRYLDNRLEFDNISPNRPAIMGQELLRNQIWIPHMIVRNEKDSSLMGADGKDVFVTINPTGLVAYSYRMAVTFYCWMNLQKFPFDSQECYIMWNSWAYNTTNLLLHWEEDNPVKIASNLHLTEFVLSGNWTKVTEVPATFNQGGRKGNYSALVFTFRLSREVGYYILDYFLPSVLLVCTSWVTFWLQADASPPRATLGTSTMLAFITLNGGLTKNLPKVSYVKASEIWFIGCASFIFLSMAEFAFVNVIWRRKKKVEVKKQSGKHILKGALTPSLARKQLRKAESEGSLYKAHSCTNLNVNGSNKNIQNNYLTVHSFPQSSSIPKISTQSQDELLRRDDSVTSIPIPEFAGINEQPTWHTMTPQEVAIWIDKKARIVFPVAFIIFNLFYWSFVYAL